MGEKEQGAFRPWGGTNDPPRAPLRGFSRLHLHPRARRPRYESHSRARKCAIDGAQAREKRRRLDSAKRRKGNVVSSRVFRLACGARRGRGTRADLLAGLCLRRAQAR